MTALWRRLLRETVWAVGLAHATEAEVLEILLGRRDLTDVEFRWIRRGGHSFVADPFLFELDDGLCLAVEDFRAVAGRGMIEVRRVRDDLGLGAQVARIVEPHHLAFPSPAVLAGRPHLIPDAATKDVTAYPLAGGPPVRIDGPERLPCTDPFLVPAGDGGTLLASDREQHLWAYTVEPTTDGGWAVTSRRRVEPGGRLAGGVLTVAGRHFRLDQDHSDGYGTATTVFEIDPAAGDFGGTYRATITAPRSTVRGERWDGTHHLSFAGGVLAVDARLRRYTPAAAPLKAWYRYRSA